MPRRLVSSSERASWREALARGALDCDGAQRPQDRTSLLSASVATRRVGGGMIQVSVLVSRSSAARDPGRRSPAPAARPSSRDPLHWMSSGAARSSSLLARYLERRLADTSVGLPTPHTGSSPYSWRAPEKEFRPGQFSATATGSRSRDRQMCEKDSWNSDISQRSPACAVQCRSRQLLPRQPRSAAQEILHRFDGRLG